MSCCPSFRCMGRGPRGLPTGAVFPGEDVMDNVHCDRPGGVGRPAAAVLDTDAGTRRPPIGLNGISLGGYVASLVASLEDGLTCAVLGVPVADLIRSFLGRHAGSPFRRPAPTHGGTRRTDWADGVAAIA